MRITLFCIILCALITSCGYKAKVKNFYIVKHWQGKEVIIPEKLEVRVQGKEITQSFPKNSSYCILNYLDTLDCLSCELRLHSWQLFRKEMDSLNINANVIFVVWSNKYDDLEKLQLINKCDIPCIYDYQNQIDSLNHFPTQSIFHTFLLDSLNRVLLIGNPITNKTLHNLYIQKMQQ